MPDLIGPIRSRVFGKLLPAGTENVPHMEYVPDNLDKRISDQKGLPQRCRENRPIPDSLECEAAIAADGETDGGLDGYRHSPAPAAGISVDGIASAHHVHGKNAVLVEAAEFARLDDRMFRDTDRIPQVLLHVDK